MSATTGFISKLKTSGNKVEPYVDSFDLTASNTEESYVFPTGTVYFSIQNTGKTVLRMTYEATETANGGSYISIYPGTSRSVDSIGAVNLTIYLRAAAVQRVEIEYWT
jgi:hypothetical protein